MPSKTSFNEQRVGREVVPLAVPTSITTAGYAPLDIVRFQGRRWYSAGGTAGNVAAILGFLGWTSSLIADYGDDAAGRQVAQDLQAANVSLQHARFRPGHGTPRLIHDIDATGHRFSFRCPDCHRSFPRSRPLPLARAAELIERKPSTDVFLFDRCNAGTLLLADYFASQGSLIVYEPSRPVRPDWTRRALQAAHIVKYAADRDSGLTDFAPHRQQAWIVTNGAAGINYRLGTGTGTGTGKRSPAFQYPIVDTAGAGDWTTAGMVHALAGRKPSTMTELTGALHWAQALAAVSCGSPGARGLARQQSAEAVVQAAQFLQARQAPLNPTTPRTPNAYRAPRNVCECCLQSQVPAHA